MRYIYLTYFPVLPLSQVVINYPCDRLLNVVSPVRSKLCDDRDHIYIYIYIFFFFFWLGFCFDSWPSLVAEMAWLPRGTWDLSCLTRQEEKGMIHVPALEVEFFF